MVDLDLGEQLRILYLYKIRVGFWTDDSPPRYKANPI